MGVKCLKWDVFYEVQKRNAKNSQRLPESPCEFLAFGEYENEEQKRIRYNKLRKIKKS